MLAGWTTPNPVWQKLNPCQLPETERTGPWSGRYSPSAPVLPPCGRNAPHAIEFSRRALDLLPEDDLYLRGELALNLGHAYWATGDVEEASKAFAESATSSQTAGNLRAAVFALRYQAKLEMIGGRLRSAEEFLRRAQRLAGDQDEQPLSAVGIVHVGMAELPQLTRRSGRRGALP